MNRSRRTFLRLTLAGSGALMLNACRKPDAAALPAGILYYTCSMHSWVREKVPGKCPVCGMDLIPVMKQGVETMTASAPGFTVPEDRQQQIGVTFTRVERKPLRRTMRAVGTVESDRQRDWAYVARTDGYVKALFVTSPGELVAAGHRLLSLYSPDLFTAEREYVMLLEGSAGTQGTMLASARERLKQWNISDAEIAALETSRTAAAEVTLCSPFRGTVKEVAAQQGGMVKAGDKLVEVVDLSSVWVWADFYESELAALHPGQQATITVGAYPGECFGGKIALIDPFLDGASRTFKVRIDVANADLKLRPGMYADVALDEEMGQGLVIPLNAIMPMGRRNLVFVDLGNGRLSPREVTLGAEYDAGYEVKAGLQEGERIVSSATFLIDAEAQIQGALGGFGGSPGETGQ